MMTIVPYSGWKRCLRIANSEIELIATLDVGPRIIRFGFIDGPNEFAEYPEQIGFSNDEVYHSYGGHRLWASPEVKGWTNHPDNSPVEWIEKRDEYILTSTIERGTQLQKQIRIRLDAQKNHVRLIHTITNHSANNCALAPWAISIMASGGRLVVPQEPFVAHSQHVLPVRPLVLWGYTEMNDSRWTWGNRFIQLQQDIESKSVQKFGALITQGWAAYLNEGHTFIKRFPYDPKATYSDFGCNAEFFTNHRMLEVESLGPLTTLNPGESVDHKEDWYLFRNINVGRMDDEIEASLSPLIQQSDVKK